MDLITCSTGSTERGAYGQYYPDYSDASRCGNNQPNPNLAHIHYDRVDATGVNFNVIGGLRAEHLRTDVVNK
ncbi:hypothetical protein SARC_05759 [Sphaeroforma arctica JP610]|uniref:Uncharacterized protein n=1 Tax=Sphaeroforma arctica JP610 TaxID=667725 RepID=A0A0L0FZF7_9EUKA|nr:hypothetical protein SARC_05759 [Sphaeroforma arctica JP610]KNC81946.1 hypothetical protein SARC_05759 [Sphaeroforma arctica JP610]|eukprot:XP_014155848.1 hypothetical protein SARC_05759 [Sphaeroforma arctica JP610]